MRRVGTVSGSIPPSALFIVFVFSIYFIYSDLFANGHFRYILFFYNYDCSMVLVTMYFILI